MAGNGLADGPKSTGWRPQSSAAARNMSRSSLIRNDSPTVIGAAIFLCYQYIPDDEWRLPMVVPTAFRGQARLRVR